MGSVRLQFGREGAMLQGRCKRTGRWGERQTATINKHAHPACCNEAPGLAQSRPAAGRCKRAQQGCAPSTKLLLPLPLCLTSAFRAWRRSAR